MPINHHHHKNPFTSNTTQPWSQTVIDMNEYRLEYSSQPVPLQQHHVHHGNARLHRLCTSFHGETYFSLFVEGLFGKSFPVIGTRQCVGVGYFTLEIYFQVKPVDKKFFEKN